MPSDESQAPRPGRKWPGAEPLASRKRAVPSSVARPLSMSGGYPSVAQTARRRRMLEDHGTGGPSRPADPRPEIVRGAPAERDHRLALGLARAQRHARRTAEKSGGDDAERAHRLRAGGRR